MTSMQQWSLNAAQYAPESFIHHMLLEALLRRFHRAQVPGIVIAMCRHIGHEPFLDGSHV